MAHFIIPAAPGTKFVMMVDDGNGKFWFKVENEVIAWRITDDGNEVVPISMDGHAARSREVKEPWILMADGTLEKPGSLNPFSSVEEAEQWHARDWLSQRLRSGSR